MGERVFLEFAVREQFFHGERKGDVSAGDGGSAGATIGLQDIAIHPDGAGAEFVEVERGVELRLAHEQFFHTGFVIEGLVGLRLIVGEGFPETQIERCQGQHKGTTGKLGSGA